MEKIYYPNIYNKYQKPSHKIHHKIYYQYRCQLINSSGVIRNYNSPKISEPLEFIITLLKWYKKLENIIIGDLELSFTKKYISDEMKEDIFKLYNSIKKARQKIKIICNDIHFFHKLIYGFILIKFTPNIKSIPLRYIYMDVSIIKQKYKCKVDSNNCNDYNGCNSCNDCGINDINTSRTTKYKKRIKYDNFNTEQKTYIEKYFKSLPLIVINPKYLPS